MDLAMFPVVNTTVTTGTSTFSQPTRSKMATHLMPLLE